MTQINADDILNIVFAYSFPAIPVKTGIQWT